MSELFASDDWDGSLPDPEEATPDEGTPAEPVAEVAPAEEADTAEPEQAEGTTDDRPRDEHGRFVKQETAEQQAERLLAGKYRTADELEAAYQELQARFGQQGGELGELRKALEERMDRFEQTVQQGPPGAVDYDTLIERNPAAAFDEAYRRQDMNALKYVSDQWNEIAPGAPQVYARAVAAENQLAELRQQIQPLHQNVADRGFYDGLRQVEQEYGPLPEILQRAQQANIPQDVAGMLLNTLEHGTPEQRVGAVKTLAVLAGGPQQQSADTLMAAAGDIARTQAAEAERAIAEAAVASAATTRPEQPALTRDDKLWALGEAIEKPRVDGWQV